MNKLRLFSIVSIMSLSCIGFFGISQALGDGQNDRFDYLIKNTNIIDGTGSPVFKGDIGIREDRIAAVGNLKGYARTVIDGAGLISCPGFIDPHTHADFTILDNPLAENFVMQGVTTFIGGNCGSTPAPLTDLTFSSWLKKVEAVGISINYAPLVGHGTIRELVMGEDHRRKATAREIEEMKKYVEEAMKSGAFGISSFGDPSPSEFADTQELIEVVRVAGEYGGIYAPHTRGTQTQWMTEDPEEFGYGIAHGPLEDAWVGRYRGYREALEISKHADISLHIAHISNAFFNPQPHPDFFERSGARATLFEIFDKAKKAGLDVTFDVIAFESSIAGARSLISEFSDARQYWVRQVGEEELRGETLIENLKKKTFRDVIRMYYDSGRIKFGMIHTKVDPYWFDRFQIIKTRNTEFNGKTVGEIARIEQKEPLDLLLDLIIEDPGTIWVQNVDPRMLPPAITEFIKHPMGMPSSDMTALPVEPDEDQTTSPTAYGLFPNYIKTYVKERAVLGLEEAIRKATSFPAQRFGIRDRGIIKKGFYADILVFDLDHIDYKGDFLNPYQIPEGIEFVFVNGKSVYRKKIHTRAMPGRVLRKSRSRVRQHFPFSSSKQVKAKPQYPENP